MTRRRSRTKMIMALFLLQCAVGFTYGWILYLMPWPPVEGSAPNPHAPLRRNAVDFSEHGTRWGRYGKMLRTSGHKPWGMFKFWKPAGVFAPIEHYFAGWDVLDDDICIDGTVLHDPHIADDDGDYVFRILPVPSQRRYGTRAVDGEEEDNSEGPSPDGTIEVEIDEPLRDSFRNLKQLAHGDEVTVCGRRAIDRAHDHQVELHPARNLIIRKENPDVTPHP